MPSFTTRVELHDGTYSDYEKLHQEMGRQGFSRTITADDGKRYHLPTAEYDCSGSLTLDLVLGRAQTAAQATGKRHGILVTQSAGRKWIGLPEVR